MIYEQRIINLLNDIITLLSSISFSVKLISVVVLFAFLFFVSVKILKSYIFKV